ncbi:MAG: hypothetical protein OEW80_11460 [Gemmatimonadota bacterium]|nr:hypothetical protein [Gemmatimonadota bacterium]
MTPCEKLSEKMPAVRHGADRWTAEEANHLVSCPDCRWEWGLVAAGAMLGDAAGHGPDPERVAEVVAQRLSTHRRRRRWVRTGMGLGLAVAASLLVLVWPGREPERGSVPIEAAGTMELPLAELEGIGPEVLEDLLAGLGDSLMDDGTLEAPGFSELAPTDLEQLLLTMEG